MFKNIHFNFFSLSFILFLFFVFQKIKKILEKNSGPAHLRFHHFILKNLAKEKLRRKANSKN